MKEDLVSIIMPTYNCEKFIESSIKSVIDQTYQNWELIIVDDCSTDSTKKIVKKYMDKYKNILYKLLLKNSGAAVARNTGIKMAKGKYIAFLDSDDLWNRNKLKEQVSFMKENNYLFTYTNYIEMDESGKLNGIKVSGPKVITQRGMFNYCWPGCLTVMYNAEKVGAIQIEDIKKNNDYAMWLKICKKANCYLLNKDLAMYRKRNGSISNHCYITLLKWHYKLYREIEHQSIICSLFNTYRNVIFGIIKKIKYISKEN